MNLTADEVQKMKVVELRAELAARGLDNRGVKAVLTERLLAALQSAGSLDSNGADQQQQLLLLQQQQQQQQQLLQEEEELESSLLADDEIGGDEVEADSLGTDTGALDETNVLVEETKTHPLSPTSRNQTPPRSSISPVKNVLPSSQSPNVIRPTSSPLASPTKTNTSPSKVSSTTTPVESTQTAQVTSTSPTKVQQQQESTSEESQVESSSASSTQLDLESSHNKDSTADVVTTTSSESVNKDEVETPMDIDSSKDSESNKRKIDDVNGETEEGSGDKPEQKKAKTESEPVVKIIPENEPDFNDDSVLLDWYKSDLNLKISTENFLEAEPILWEEFPFAYSGAKATYGFNSGKLYYEVKWTDSFDVKIDFGEGESKHVLRVGWSDLHTGLQLGQEKFSYGWDSTGKLFKGGEVEDFGETFGKDDVVGAILNLDGTETSVELKFTKNGAIVGSTVEIPKTDFEGKTLFPHILSRNVKFDVNFGSKEAMFKELEEGYKFVDDAELFNSRVRGPVRPSSKEECEFVMLCGIAGCGKTKWSKDHEQANLDKHFNILGTSTIIERSIRDPTVISKNTNRKYDGFFQKAGKFVEKLIEMAPSRRRNYILDQSNVVPSSQKRKSAGFLGFNRKAVVIVPSDEEYQKRIKAKEQDQNKSVPKSTILDMKATFKIPEVGDIFSEVMFPELDREASQELVTKYNKEGVSAGYGRPIPSRGGSNRYARGRGRGGQSQRGGGGFRDGRGGGGGGGGGNWRGPRSGPVRGNFGPRGSPGPRGGLGMRGGPQRPSNIPQRIPRSGGRGGGSWSGSGGRGSNGASAIPTRINRNRGGAGMGGNRGSSWRGGNGSTFPSGGRSNFGGGGGRFGGQQFPQGGYQRGPSGPNWNQGGGGQGNINVWAQQQNRSSGSNKPGYGGGFGQGAFPDPWQQVPDQGFGQSWDSSGNRSGGGTWQGYGGQTYGNYGNVGRR